MLALLLAVTASIAWGGASVFGGHAARSASALTVAWWSSFLAVPGIALLAFLITGVDAFEVQPVAIGLLAGPAAVIGGTLLFLGFSKAPASSVVPSSGLMSAIVPVTVAAVVLDEALSILAVAGVALALGAIWLVASDGEKFDVRGLRYGIASGTSFGFQFAILGFVGDTAGLWPIVGVMTGASLVGAVIVMVSRSPRSLPKNARWLAAGGAACSIVATTTYLYATRLGSLTTASVLGALYAVPAVVLAAVFLKEVILPRHWVGLGLAGIATAFISL